MTNTIVMIPVSKSYSQGLPSSEIQLFSWKQPLLGKYAKTKNHDNSISQMPQNVQHYCYDTGKHTILTKPFKLANSEFFPGNRLCSASMKRKRDPDNLFLNSTWMNLSKSQLTFVSPS